MLTVIFYIIAVLAIVILYKENTKLKLKNEIFVLEHEALANRYKHLEKTNNELEKHNLSFKKDLNELNILKREKKNLLNEFEKLKSSNGIIKGTSKENIENLEQDELKFLKKKDIQIQEESKLLNQDNDLLKQDNFLLKQDSKNLRKQVSELRQSKKNIPKYLDSINELNNKVQELIEKNKTLTIALHQSKEK